MARRDRHVFYGWSRPRDTSEEIKKYCSDLDALLEVLHGDCFPSYVRAAAGLFVLSLSADAHVVEQVIGQLAAMKSAVNEKWLAIGIVAFSGPLIRRRNRAAETFVDQILRDSRDEYAVRAAMELYIREWREFTRSPVSESIDSNIWL
ncbi:hypothetical protein CA234_06550 [Sphingomonas sp. ABOLE]|nr:hypothetical protein CA234_06550 [Sphingomonas sp. ABOLE]